MKLLLIEDNEELGELLARGLAAAGYSADRVTSLLEAIDALSVRRYAAVVLDLGLPDGDGSSIVRDLRERGDATPVLILTARGGVRDRINGLRVGADDYMPKPFDLEELTARIEALLRRSGALQGIPLRVGDVTLDTRAHRVSVGDTVQFFSSREVAVLEILMRRSGRVVPKRVIEDHLFGASSELGSNAVEVYVHRVRRQLAKVGALVEIHTIRGVGYLMRQKS